MTKEQVIEIMKEALRIEVSNYRDSVEISFYVGDELIEFVTVGRGRND